MRKSFTVLFALCFSLISVAASAKEVKVLIIANSFGICVLDYLPQIAKEQEKDLKIASLYIGGCSLERHIDELHKAEKDPNHKPYKTNYPEISNPPIRSKYKYSANLPEMIDKEKWDIVVTQQQSSRAQDYETYQPYADELIAYIKKNAPQAEIVIQETWSYRQDSSYFKENLTSEKMAEKIHDAYRKLAALGPYRVIPTGTAVQIYRKKYAASGKPFIEFAKMKVEEDKSYRNVDGDVVGNIGWNAKTKKHSFDYNHLAASGDYLQACVWYYTLIGSPEEKIKLRPEAFDAELVDMLQESAAEAVRNYQQLTKEPKQAE